MHYGNGYMVRVDGIENNKNRENFNYKNLLSVKTLQYNKKQKMKKKKNRRKIYKALVVLDDRRRHDYGSMANGDPGISLSPYLMKTNPLTLSGIR